MAVTFGVLVVVCQLVLAAQAANFVVVSAPDSIKFDKDAGALAASDVSKVISNVMGFESASTLVPWTGLYGGSAFRRPAASLSIFLDGYTDALPLPTLRNSFHLTGFSSLPEVVSPAAGSVATIVSEAAAQSFTFSMSSSEELASDGSTRDASGNSDVVVAHHAGRGFASADHVYVSEAEVEVLFAKQMLGGDVVYANNAFTAAGVNFALADPAVRALFAELHAMVATAQALRPAAGVPAVLTFTVSSLRTISLSAAQQRALATVLGRFVETMSAVVNAATANNAITTVIAVPVAHHVSARGVFTPYVAQSFSAAAAAPAGAVPFAISNTPTAYPRSRDYIDYCQTYAYYCNKDKNNTAFPTTGGDTVCNGASNAQGNCPFIPCGYSTGTTPSNVQIGAAKCIQCKPGFTLQNGRCYVSSNYPGMFQIWFFGGLAIAIALFATCNAIGNMDPGRNGIIYRMTAQRLKTN